MEQIRVFIALNMPVGDLREVTRVQKALRAAARRQSVHLSWVPASNMHITLRFLGDMPRASALAIRDRLATRLEGREPFALDLAGLGVFPDEEKPRVLWLGVEDQTGGLARLVTDVEGCLDELGYAKDPRPFHAHLTLGRFGRGSSPPPLWKGLEVPVLSTRGDEVVLYQSELLQTGAEYTALARFPLTPPRVDPVVSAETQEIQEIQETKNEQGA